MKGSRKKVEAIGEGSASPVVSIKTPSLARGLRFRV